MFKRSLFLLGALSFASQSFAAESTDLEISIYNNNLALVKDTRQINLKQGKNDIAFEGVATQLKPESVIIVGKGINVLEQNYNYDLITPQNMIEKSIGQEVKTVMLNPETGKNIFDTAKIVSANHGNPVLEFSYGIEPNFPGRVVFDKLPKGLQSKPTLAAKVISLEEGTEDLSLAYLTNGISWKTNYVAKVSSADKLDLTGWVTINNQSGIDYGNARVQLIAGDVNQVIAPRPQYKAARVMTMAFSETADNAMGGSVEPEQISGYQLYTLPEKTDIKDNQTKQISLIEKTDVKYQKEGRLTSYLYLGGNSTSEFEKKHPALYYILNNTEEDNLGLPLPAGTVRFYENDNNGSMQFIGEDSIHHIAKNEKIELSLGNLFNVFVSGKVSKVTKVSEEKVSSKNNNCGNYKIVRDYEVAVTFNNGGKNSEEIVFTQDINQNIKILKSNIDGKSKNVNQYQWRIVVPADNKTELTFTARNTATEHRCD